MPSLEFPKILDPLDEQWSTFISSRTETHIFQHPAWINLMAESYGYRPFVLAVCDSDGQVSAGLPIMEVNSFLTGRRLVSLPFTDFCAPLYRSQEALNRLTEGLVAFSKSDGPCRIELRWEFPPNPEIHSYSHFVMHTTQLQPDAEIVFRQLQQTKRRYIRVAEKKGVRVEWGFNREHLQKFYRLHLYTRRKHGMPTQPWRFFELLGRNLLEKGLGFVLLANKEDECIAGMICLHWQKTLTYKFGASDQSKLDLHPNHLLFWTAIRWGCEHGYNLFDLGRSEFTKVGLREFKSNWASEEKPLIYSTISTKPPKLTNGRLMAAMSVIIHNSPVWVNRLIGELLYRHMG